MSQTTEKDLLLPIGQEEDLRLPSHLSDELLVKVGSRTGEEISRIKLIATGSSYPIRNYEEKKFQILSVMTIASVAVDYCGADVELNESAFIECAKLLLKKFGSFGISEVKEAFAMAAACRLGEINLTAYKGVFTVAMFGEVLSSYSFYRNRILSEISEEVKRKELEELEERKKVRLELARKQVVEKFERLKQENCEITRVSEVPGWWAPILSELGLIKSDPASWVLAKKRICEKFCSSYLIRENDLMFTMIERARIVSEIQKDPEHFPVELNARAEVLYGQILVFRYLAKFKEVE